MNGSAGASSGAAREQTQREREALKAAKEQYLLSRQEEAAEFTAQVGRARGRQRHDRRR